MKRFLFFILFFPLLMWGQSKTYLDSVNYYFGILLTHERDSINQYRIKHNTGEKILNRATEEKDESKFVNPWKHIDYCIEESHQMKKFNAHSTTNKENMMFQWAAYDYSDSWSDPKTAAHELFQGWKNSPGHYKFMIQDTDGYGSFFRGGDYKTYKVLIKMSYIECTIEDLKERKKCPWVMVASFTAWD
jgi:hypothetical protein